MYSGKLLVYTKIKNDTDKDMEHVISKLNKMLRNLTSIRLTQQETKNYNRFFEILDGKKFYYCVCHPNICIDWTSLSEDYKKVNISEIADKLEQDIETLIPLILPKGMTLDEVLK